MAAVLNLYLVLVSQQELADSATVQVTKLPL
jgi:hypothetical protein